MFTSLQGYVNTDYDTLVKTFGEPKFGPDQPSDDEKVTCEWRLTLGGETVTIYDWKEYTGETPRGEYEWHVGGKSRRAASLVENALATGTVGPLARYTNNELRRLLVAASLLAVYADEQEGGSEDYDKFYGIAMEFENELRERKAPGY